VFLKDEADDDREDCADIDILGNAPDVAVLPIILFLIGVLKVLLN
jgi:hypothetical protein